MENIANVAKVHNRALISIFFSDNVNGLYSVAAPIISGCTFINNSGTAIKGHTGEVLNNQIINNNIGLEYSMSGGFEAADIKYNTIAENNIGFIITGNQLLRRLYHWWEVYNSLFSCYKFSL